MDISKKTTSRREFLQKTAGVSLAASAFANWGCAPSESGRPKPPNILLLSLDTTRADHLAPYGYARQTTPVLDSIVKDAVVYARAITTSSWTLPAHASMFTGKFVTSHGARKYGEGDLTLDAAFDGGDFFERYRVRTISPDEPLLAEHLKRAGYDTGAVVAGPWLKKAFGLHRGFDYHDDDNILGTHSRQKRLGVEVTTRAVDWLKRERDKPFFLFLNYFDPHNPYVIPDNFIRRFNNTPNPGLHEVDPLNYDHCILFMDFALKLLFDAMRNLNLLDNTMIIAIGDHGELFGEHGQFGHGSFLYQGELHVPFWVRYPIGEVPAAVRTEFIQPVDLLPLIFNRLDLEVPREVQGSHPEMISHPILAEVYPQEVESGAGHWQCLIENGKKLLFNSKGNHELYDLDADPREEKNLAAENPDLLRDMTAKLITHFQALPRPEGAPAPLQVDDATLDELESMGYL